MDRKIVGNIYHPSLTQWWAARILHHLTDGAQPSFWLSVIYFFYRPKPEPEPSHFCWPTLRFLSVKILFVSTDNFGAVLVVRWKYCVGDELRKSEHNIMSVRCLSVHIHEKRIICCHIQFYQVVAIVEQIFLVLFYSLISSEPFFWLTVCKSLLRRKLLSIGWVRFKSVFK